MVRSSDITNFTELRQNMRDHFDRVKTTGRPLFVTTNGETEAVVLSPRAFDELAQKAEHAELLEMIARSDAEFRAGKGMPVDVAFREIARKLGIPWNR